MEKITNSPKRTARWWNWTSDENNERILRIEGTIAENSWVDDEITPKQFKAELMSGSGDITVFINSVGGDVIAAAQIYNMLMEYKGNVTVKIDGIAASAASVVAMAGTQILISPVSSMMIYNPMTGAFGDTDDMQKAISRTFTSQNIAFDGRRNLDERAKSRRVGICRRNFVCK